MHRALAVPVAFALASCQSQGASLLPEAHADPAATVAPTPGAKAVVELFTSEGCSSCPPADTVLADLAPQPDVVALSFHVDYWDELGWPDRFATPDITARQRAYSRSFGTRGMYTPQMVVGGVEQFAGSDRERAQAAVARALARPPVVTLGIRARRTGEDTLSLDYTAPGAPRGAVLDVAVVERSASTVVRAGENAGRTMKHANVVRAFSVVPLAEAGSTVVHVPRSLRAQDAEIVAYAQREASEGGGMPVLGASVVPVP